MSALCLGSDGERCGDSDMKTKGAFHVPRTLKSEDGVLDILVARIGGTLAPSDSDMAAINSHSRETLTPDDVYVFPAVVSTDRLNSYNFRMADSTLQNFLAEAEDTPCLIAHNTNSLPIGRSFEGSAYQDDEGRGVAVKAYILRGCEVSGTRTDDVVRLIQSGVTKDISVGWGGADAWFRCSVCGLDLFSDDCPHVPGATYDGEKAFSWLEDAHMREFSPVFRHADPGARVLRDKAQAAMLSGKLSAEQAKEVGDAWGIPLVSDNHPEGDITEVRTMNARALLDRIRGFFSSEKHPTIAKALDDMRLKVAEDASVESVADQVGSLLQSSVSADTELADGLRGLGLDSLDKVKALAERAKLGDQYRADLVTQTLAAGVRAYGEEFQKDFYTKVLSEPERSADDIKAFLAQFEADAKRRLGEPGRQTSPAPVGTPATNRTLRDLSVEEFERLSANEQDKLIEEHKKVAEEYKKGR
jgi:hypothetical protein